MLYYAYIYPYMTYRIEVWGCASLFYKVGLIMYKYSNNLLPECISLLY